MLKKIQMTYENLKEIIAMETINQILELIKLNAYSGTPENIQAIIDLVKKQEATLRIHDAKLPVRRSAIFSATYVGSEFPELNGQKFLVDDDLNEEGCFIMKVGHDWINSIPYTDLHFA